MLAVKENQGQLYEGIRDLFEGAAALGFDGVPYDYAHTVNKGHGRVEGGSAAGPSPQRTAWTTSTLTGNDPN